jgi:DNA-binding transcriptional ArsR family regulator
VQDHHDVPAGTADRVDKAQTALLNRDAEDFLERVKQVVCEMTRSQMLRALRATPLDVSEMTRVLGCSKWTASRHLRTLRESGLVISRRRGRRVSYRLAQGPVVDAALAALDVVEAAIPT